MNNFQEAKRILLIFGTRPEAIKMAPVIRLFREQEQLQIAVCVTAQHREMLDQVLDFFELKPDYDLDIMRENQDLFSLTATLITALKPVFEDFRPDLVLVHGDTTTTLMGSLAAFYSEARVGHIEAGLRTRNKNSPFPEEINRQLTTRLTDLHFAPTAQAKKNLLEEGVEDSLICVTGNTVIDALEYTVERVKSGIPQFAADLPLDNKKLILITGHRRENFGAGMKNVCKALLHLARTRKDIHLVYPVHLNPKVGDVVHDLLGGQKNISLIDPLSYPDFVWLMNRSYCIITDSGGVQEEAPGLGKPVLVTRNTTERPEAVEAGTVKLTGTDTEKLIRGVVELLDDPGAYDRMSRAHNPYGDGKASERILNFIQQNL